MSEQAVTQDAIESLAHSIGAKCSFDGPEVDLLFPVGMGFAGGHFFSWESAYAALLRRKGAQQKPLHPLAVLVNDILNDYDSEAVRKGLEDFLRRCQEEDAKKNTSGEASSR